MSITSQLIKTHYDAENEVDIEFRSISSLKHNGSSYTSYQVRRGEKFLYMGTSLLEASAVYDDAINGLPDNIVRLH
jgi:hypothetical protein